ncbi:conditioned medium factor receptor 1-like [Babylonia areolata]|uniref:conditioned medium factor receptor 1-like n=1 Tax=Babylonia areolata TaxID=304850 RepID=UPI003FD665E9
MIVELAVFVAALVIVLAVFAIFILSKDVETPVSLFASKYPEDRKKDKAVDHYDACIVGAGPAGATCAYYLSKAGWKVILLEKKKFPRDKYCGDAVCKTAIEILMDMGILDSLIKQNKAHVSDSGGMVSPSGLSFIGRSKEGLGDIPAAIAVKRLHLDEAIAMAAKRVGADLREEVPVKDAVLDKQSGLWTVSVEDDDRTFQSRVLVCADGAPSRLATQLGLVTKPPDSICSRAYVEGGTHCFKADGLVVYNRNLLPGYSALFRHPNDELNFCCYIIPGNPKVKGEELAYWHKFILEKDPSLVKALGDSYKMERMKAASLRLGGEKVTTGDHVLVVGDAAGMMDPLTGEGIHHAMEGGKLAAEFLGEAFAVGNYDANVMKIFHQRWMSRFGFDFKWSMMFCQMMYRFPILIDAATAAVQRKGESFLLKWADIMTGRVPKIRMLYPEFSVVITFELVILVFKRLFGFGKGEEKKKET